MPWMKADADMWMDLDKKCRPHSINHLMRMFPLHPTIVFAMQIVNTCSFQGGRGAEVSVSSTSKIGDVKVAAQKSLGQGQGETAKFHCH